MTRCLTHHFSALLCSIAILGAATPAAHAADPTATVMLVATPALSDPVYRASVLVASPMADGLSLSIGKRSWKMFSHAASLLPVRGP